MNPSPQSTWWSPTRDTITAAGVPETKSTYEPFGEATRTKLDPAALDTLLAYTGERLDPTLGLVHLRARDYDPTQGHFLATDPLTPDIDDPYVAAYVYAGSQPTVYTDPSGEIKFPPDKFGSGGGGPGSAGAKANVDGEFLKRLGSSIANRIASIGTRRSLICSNLQLQKKFKHAGVFGVEGNYSNVSARAFEKALRDFLGRKSTIHVKGKYKGDKAILNYDTKTSLVVVQDRSGRLITAYRMNVDQLMNVIQRRSLGGG